MPTGGVNAKNLMDYLSFDQIVACGGTWMVKKELIEGERWEEITRMTREAVRTMLGFSLHHVGINCCSEAEADGRPGHCAPCLDSSIRWATPPYRRCLRQSAPRRPVPGPTATSPSAPTAWTGRSIIWVFRASRCLEETRKTDGKGRTKAIYLDGTFGGFAIHLVQK